MNGRYIAVLGTLMAVLAISTSAAPITTGSLVREMIDMHRLTTFPDPAYETVQFSSYDHRSDHPGGPGWFANSDGFGNEPVPNFEAVVTEPGGDGIGEYLICDVRQPGAIVRVWTAAIEGTIRMYLDGASEPVFDGPANEFCRNTFKGYAKAARIKYSDLEGTFQQRNAAYFPIPFAERCRIVWTGNAKRIHFYQIQIRLYEPGAEVVTFQPSDLRTYRDDIKEVAEVLASCDEEWPYAAADETPVEIVGTVPPRETLEVLSLEGSQAVERLILKMYAEDLDLALRQTVLHISCDGYPWGQVQSPVGDFFGVAPGINPYDSVPFTVRPDGTMVCRYVMPFAKSMKISLDNRGEQPVTVTGSALTLPYDWDAGRSMHFRARWRIDHDLVANGGAVQDLPFLIANGAGTYVGTTSMLLNPNEVPTPGGNWWGEGDEKIFVDDDVRPSTFGTGSEDYYNYAWSSPDIFVFPYCGQPRNDGPANRGFVTNNRWQIIDDLPFKQRISFYMELYSHERTPGVSYARIGYHYARPGLMDDHLPITDEDIRPLQLPENWQPKARGAASNSVFFQAESLLRSDADVTLEQDNLWSGSQLMVWNAKRRGDEITLTIPVREDGKYKINIAAALRPDSAPVAVRLDGEKIGIGGEKGVADLYVPHRTLLRNLYSSDIELTKGEHELELTFQGSRRRGGKSVGIDFIWIRKR